MQRYHLVSLWGDLSRRTTFGRKKMLHPRQELLVVTEEIHRIIDKHKAWFHASRCDWLLGEDGTMKRYMRGSLNWRFAKLRFHCQGFDHWYDHFTGRRTNLNSDHNGEPVWDYETVRDRIEKDSKRVLLKYQFCDSEETFEETFADIVESLLTDPAIVKAWREFRGRLV